MVAMTPFQDYFKKLYFTKYIEWIIRQTRSVSTIYYY